MAWLLPSEVQPLETRSVGQSFATAVNFLASATSSTERAYSSAKLGTEVRQNAPCITGGRS